MAGSTIVAYWVEKYRLARRYYKMGRGKKKKKVVLEIGWRL